MLKMSDVSARGRNGGAPKANAPIEATKRHLTAENDLWRAAGNVQWLSNFRETQSGAGGVGCEAGAVRDEGG